MNATTTFYLKYAEPSEFQKVMDFYANEDRRAGAVYLRDPRVIQDVLKKGLFLTVRDANDTIVAGSALYTLANGNHIAALGHQDKATGTERVIESGRVVELGSVLRMNNRSGKPDDIDLPPGIWHLLLFGVPMIRAFEKANPPELPIDMLVANVQIDLVNTVNHITGAASTKSVLRWERIEAAKQLENSFKATTAEEDPNVARPKLFYRAPVGNLYKVAKELLVYAQRDYVTNRDGERIGLDFSALKIEDTLHKIAEREQYFTKKILHHTSWTEAARLIDSTTPKDYRGSGARRPQAQSPANQSYPAPAPGVAVAGGR